ncbi:MAG: hypothetical protein WC763_05280 [Candidatus Paceibacterota bacterium]|jgi:hypothetical protein
MLKMYVIETMFNAELTVLVGDFTKASEWGGSRGFAKDFTKLWDAEGCFLHKGETHVIWMPKWNPGVLVHEAIHFAIHVVRKNLRMKMLKEADEAVAWITEDVFAKAIKKGRK